MKLAIAIALAAVSLSSFAQDQRCEMRAQKLQERVNSLTSQLRYCETSNPGRVEIQELREENNRLSELNRVLQRRIDRLEGRQEMTQVLCAAACTDYTGNLDLRYMQTGVGITRTEADLVAKQTVQQKNSCNYGVKTYDCEEIVGQQSKNFCTAACTDYAGNVDQRFMAGVRGRNKVEAKVLTIKEVQTKYSCNYGIKVISCE